MLVAAPAHASTVELKTFPADCSGKVADCVPIIVYSADPGEGNNLQLTVSPGEPPVAHITDTVDMRIGTASRWCTAAGPHQVDCAPPAYAYGNYLEFDLGDADDRITVTGTNPKTFHVIVNGGAGDDELHAEADAAGAALAGGQGRDVLAGGLAKDWLSGDGTFAHYPYRPVDRRGSSDRIDGGGGVDTLFYSGRTQGVSVDLSTGRGGEPGERDAIANTEQVIGGSGPDRLLGTAGPDLLDGELGDDVISGRAGNDALDGGPGRNQLAGGPGNDGIVTGSRHSRSLVRCGSGSDDVGDAAPRDVVRDDCERVSGSALENNATLRLLGPVATTRSPAVRYDTRCSMILSQQRRHMVCRVRLSLVTPEGIVVGSTEARSHRTAYRDPLRIPVRLNRLGRELLQRSHALRVRVRLAEGLTRQHGPVPGPVETLFTTVIRLAR